MGAPKLSDLGDLMEEFLSESDLSPAQAKKRRRIVQSATALFLRHGYRRTSVDEIARHAHVAKGTIYTYFRNKAELLIHAIAEEKRGLLPLLEPIFAAPEPRERLRRWARLAFEATDRLPLTSAVMRGDREVLIALDEIDERLKDFFREQQQQFLADLVAEAAAPTELSERELADRVHALLALVYSAPFITDERLRGGLPLHRFARILGDLAVDGLLASPED